MRRLLVLLIALAACEEDEAAIAVQVRRLQNPAERLDALKSIEKTIEWSVRDAPSAEEVRAAVAPVIALAEKGEPEVRLQALATLDALSGRLLADREAGAEIAGILKALTAVLLSRDEERLREVAAMRLGTLVGNIDADPRLAALGGVGEAVENAFAALLRASGDESDDVRGEVLFSLGSTRRKEAVPIVTRGLRESWNRVDHSNGAAGALKSIGEKHAEARVALIEVAGDESLPERCRREAAQMLGHLGALGHLGPESARAVAVLLKCLVAGDDGYAWLRGSAARSLGQIPNASEATVLSLVAATKDDDPRVRKDVVEALEAIGKGGRVVEALVARLEDEDRLVRQAAATALAALGPEAAPALPALLRIAQSMNPFLRKSAAEALGRIGRTDPSVLQALVGAARDPDVSVRMAGLMSLGALAPDDPKVVEALSEATADPDEFVRAEAARSLGLCGRRSDEALKQAIGILGGSDPGLRRAATDALEALGPRAAPAVPALAAALAVDDEWLRRAAISALEAIGPDAAPAIPALRKIPAAAGLAIEVAEAIWDIAGDPSDLLPLCARDMAAAAGKDTLFSDVPLSALIDASKGERPPPPEGFGDPRLGAAWEIGRRGPEAAEAAAALSSLVRAGPRDLAVAAAAALSRIGKAAVPLLVGLLEAESADALTLAATALGEIGADASAALPRLREVAKGTEPRVRRAAEAAIARIGK